MRFITLLFLLSLTCLYLALAQVSYEDCCLKYVKENPYHKRHAVTYRYQETDGGCNIPAIIFVMRKGRLVCANPREAWVVQLKSKLDRRAIKARMQHKTKRTRV
ncbi:C-C motif chemokine 20 isoform X2 [Betta splendens]|uniref:C-C motif chemokine 20 isoform X2 n=1 Tax=Betta splendens TaxID=158456 RepID=A0A6P7L2K3_BETSP|nr:C-C motif chemokine 20 isoform X2 [Betta splendens]